MIPQYLKLKHNSCQPETFKFITFTSQNLIFWLTDLSLRLLEHPLSKLTLLTSFSIPLSDLDRSLIVFHSGQDVKEVVLPPSLPYLLIELASFCDSDTDRPSVDSIDGPKLIEVAVLDIVEFVLLPEIRIEAFALARTSFLFYVSGYHYGILKMLKTLDVCILVLKKIISALKNAWQILKN